MVVRHIHGAPERARERVQLRQDVLVVVPEVDVGGGGRQQRQPPAQQADDRVVPGHGARHSRQIIVRTLDAQGCAVVEAVLGACSGCAADSDSAHVLCHSQQSVCEAPCNSI